MFCIMRLISRNQCRTFVKLTLIQAIVNDVGIDTLIDLSGRVRHFSGRDEVILPCVFIGQNEDENPCEIWG
jgi:hypothetical protein